MTERQTSAECTARFTETVAVLGAGGTMGLPMAANIARAGLPVRAWNRSPDKAEPLSRDGAFLAGSPAEAADGATIVLTMLADADAVLSAMDGPDGALPVMAGQDQADHPIWLQMSTIGEEATQQCIGLANRYGVGFVDAPSFRLALAAKDASLVRASAREHGLDLPMLDLIARRLHEGAAEHGDEDFSATYLTSAPGRAA
jgi:3-hydroxyisobutyrate dehydrogenase